MSKPVKSKLQTRYGSDFTGRSHQYWHLDENDRLWNRAVGRVLAAPLLTERSSLTTARAVNEDDDFASRQKWTLAANNSNIFEWQNDTFSDYEMEIMMQSDAFAQSSSYHLDEMSGDFRHSHYDYWIESIFEYTSQDHDYDVEKNICNTEHILPDDWRFGLQDAYGNAHGSNWTTHDGKTHFLYGEAFESEYKDEVNHIDHESGQGAPFFLHDVIQ